VRSGRRPGRALPRRPTNKGGKKRSKDGTAPRGARGKGKKRDVFLLITREGGGGGLWGTTYRTEEKEEREPSLSIPYRMSQAPREEAKTREIFMFQEERG